MGKLQSQKERRRPIRNLLMKAAPLVAAVSISCAPIVERPRAPKAVPAKAVKTDLDEFIDALMDPYTQGIALDGLASIGKRAVPRLIGLLKGDDKVRSENAAIALARIGKAASPALMKLLGSADAAHRYRAVITLGLIQEMKAIPAFVSLLDDQSYDVKMMSIWALVQTGAERELFKALDHKDPKVRKASIYMIVGIPVYPKSMFLLSGRAIMLANIAGITTREIISEVSLEPSELIAKLKEISRQDPDEMVRKAAKKAFRALTRDFLDPKNR